MFKIPLAENPELVLVFFGGTLGMILLASAIFFFFVTYQKRLLKKEIELNKVKANQQKEILLNTIYSQEKERKRIAQDLHDDVGAMLSVVKLNIARIEKSMANRNTDELAKETKAYIDDVIFQVRRISRDLLPPSLEKLGITFALSELANWINKSGLIHVNYWELGDKFRFDTEKELAVFRIVQEVVNNAIKHSGAKQINITVRFATQRISVLINDNGRGFKIKEKTESGLGLKNLKSRTQILNAKFKIKSKPGNGTTAIFLLKMNARNN